MERATSQRMIGESKGSLSVLFAFDQMGSCSTGKGCQNGMSNFAESSFFDRLSQVIDSTWLDFWLLGLVHRRNCLVGHDMSISPRSGMAQYVQDRNMSPDINISPCM